MKKMKLLKNILIIILVSALLLGLCSCKSEKEDEPSSQTETATVTTTATQTTGENTQTQQEESTSLTEQMSEQPSSQNQQTQDLSETQYQTVTQTQQLTEPVVVSGTETITDGNKTIVFPSALRNSSNKYPVIAWANGTGCPTQTYLSLLQLLANGGYVVIADSSVMTADGKSQIDSINYIIGKNSDESSIFRNKIDTSKIGVCGHSQGGRSCVNAAQVDSRIRCVVSIAGASSADEAKGLKTPILFLTGTSDLVVVSSQWCLPSYDAVSGRAAYASLKGGIHTTCMTNPSSVSNYVLDWFNGYLRNDSSAKNVFVNGGKLSTDPLWQDYKEKN